jgi:ATP-binding cassette subfamily C protein LapB
VRARIIDMTGKKIDVVLAANIFEHIMSLKLSQRPASVGILANQMRDFDQCVNFSPPAQLSRRRICFSR